MKKYIKPAIDEIIVGTECQILSASGVSGDLTGNDQIGGSQRSSGYKDKDYDFDDDW